MSYDTAETWKQVSVLLSSQDFPPAPEDGSGGYAYARMLSFHGTFSDKIFI